MGLDSKVQHLEQAQVESRGDLPTETTPGTNDSTGAELWPRLRQDTPATVVIPGCIDVHAKVSQIKI